MNKGVIKLSPSTIGLFLECPYCFWLQFNKNIHSPRGIFPSLPSGMDAVIKRYYDTYREKGALPPEIEGKVDGKLFKDSLLKKWRSNWEGLKYFDKQLNVELKGILDDCLVDGDIFIPLDYKTRGFELKEDSTSYYQHQLDIYCYLLSKNGYKVANHAYLIYYYPRLVKENGVVDFEVLPKRVETSIENAEKTVKDAMACLRGSEPQRHTECEYCSWKLEPLSE